MAEYIAPPAITPQANAPATNTFRSAQVTSQCSQDFEL
jgi:hypothetical protein